MPSTFERTIRRRLKAIADKDAVVSYTRYFKPVVHFIGVRTPELRRIACEEMPRLDREPMEAITAT